MIKKHVLGVKEDPERQQWPLVAVLLISSAAGGSGGQGVCVRAISERACGPAGRLGGPPAQRLPGEAEGRAATQQ